MGSETGQRGMEKGTHTCTPTPTQPHQHPHLPPAHTEKEMSLGLWRWMQQRLAQGSRAVAPVSDEEPEGSQGAGVVDAHAGVGGTKGMASNPEGTLDLGASDGRSRPSVSPSPEEDAATWLRGVFACHPIKMKSHLGVIGTSRVLQCLLARY